MSPGGIVSSVVSERIGVRFSLWNRLLCPSELSSLPPSLFFLHFLIPSSLSERCPFNTIDVYGVQTCLEMPC